MKRWPIALGTVVVLGLAVLLCRQPQSAALQKKPVAGRSLPTAFGALYPAVSPDGKVVAFTYQGAICTMATSGGDVQRLTDKPGFDLEPTWSPDGSLIAFCRSPNRAGGLLTVINVNTREEIKLPKRVIVRGTIAYYKLQFHLDGEQILGVFQVEREDVGLAWFNIKTGETTRAANLSRWAKYAASKDGKKVFYTATPDVARQQTGSHGWHTTIFQAGQDEKCVGVYPARIHDICAEGNGRSLILSTDVGGMAFYDLWQVPIRDGKLDMHRATQLTFGQGDEHRPTIAGQQLVYTDNHKGATELRKQHLGTGKDVSIQPASLDFNSKTGALHLTIVDSQTKKPIVARVSIERDGGKFHAPPGSLYRVVNNYGHFYCEQDSKFDLPVGKYRLRAFHGPEFRASHAAFEISEGKPHDLELKMQRWTDQSKNAWHCGENHIHANYGYGEWYNSPKTMFAQSAGEALEVSNFMVANSDGDGIFDRRYFRGGVDPISTKETLLYWNQEFRSTIWGHMTLVNLSHLVEPIMTGFRDTRSPWDIPTNSDIAKKTHLQNGLVNYTHVAQRADDPYTNPYTGKAIPVDVALGNIDSLDLNATYNGTVPLWYRLLNCGFRLTASAGTDCFLNRVRSRLPGGDRVYVQVRGPFSYDSWIDGLRAGRTFVTNGPMLRFSVGLHRIGDDVKLATGKTFKVTAQANAQFPLTRLELIQNGKVIHSAKPNAEGLVASIETDVEIKSGCWLAVRAIGPGHADHPVGSQYAHTSPIYFEVAGQGARSKEDAANFLKWIDRLGLAVRLRDRIPSDELKKHVRDQFERARSVYQAVIDGK
jgi:hypothetical protein